MKITNKELDKLASLFTFILIIICVYIYIKEFSLIYYFPPVLIFGAIAAYVQHIKDENKANNN